MMGFYFNRYRNFAFGFVTMAVGIGQICLAPLVSHLIATYGWRGTMIILSGLMAHFAVIGAVLRPVDFDPEFSYDDDEIGAKDDVDVCVDVAPQEKLLLPGTETNCDATTGGGGLMNCNFKSSNGTVVSEKDSLHERGGLIPAHVANDVIIVPPALAPGVKAAGGDAAASNAAGGAADRLRLRGGDLEREPRGGAGAGAAAGGSGGG